MLETILLLFCRCAACFQVNPLPPLGDNPGEAAGRALLGVGPGPLGDNPGGAAGLPRCACASRSSRWASIRV